MQRRIVVGQILETGLQLLTLYEGDVPQYQVEVVHKELTPSQFVRIVTELAENPLSILVLNVLASLGTKIDEIVVSGDIDLEPPLDVDFEVDRLVTAGIGGEQLTLHTQHLLASLPDGFIPAGSDPDEK